MGRKRILRIFGSLLTEPYSGYKVPFLSKTKNSNSPMSDSDTTILNRPCNCVVTNIS